MRTNTKVSLPPVETHGGGRASHITPLQELKRTVMACLLWEGTFYEDGVSIADRIKDLVSKCKPEDVLQVALQARNEQHLRHVPLLLMTYVNTRTPRYADTLAGVIQRPDELAEFLSLYWKGGKCPIAAAIKKGLAKAFTKFNEYSLAKYNRDNAIKLRDVMFLVRPKPKDEEQAAVFKRLANKELKTPDTWEVALSGGADKKETFERLMREGSLGYLALLRNLRNMEQSGVDRGLIKQSLLIAPGKSKVLPFRFIAAAKACPALEPEIDQAMLESFTQREKLPGVTVAVIDVSGSMYGEVMSGKSDMNRALAACALAAILREICEDPRIYATAGSDAYKKHKTQLVPARRGMALVDAVYDMCHPLGSGGIFLNQVIRFIEKDVKSADRVIVITDEQDCSHSSDSPSKAPLIGKHNYIINVATDKRGIGYERWTHINGFSESVIAYIAASEQ